MASSLERSLYPQAGLTPTSGVQYFGNTGRGMNVDYFSQVPPAAQAPASSRPAANVNPGFSTPAASDFETPGAGFLTTPTELGFGGEGTAAPGAPGGGISPGTAAAMGGVASLGSVAAGLTGNQGLGMASGALGSMAAASQGNMGPALGMMGSVAGLSPAASAALGIAGTAMSPTGSVNSAIGSTLGGLLGSAAFGPIGAFAGSQLGAMAAPAVGVATDALATIGQVALGQVVNAFSTPNTQEQQDAIAVVDMGPTSPGTSPSSGNSDATNATGISGLGLSDTNQGPPDSGPSGVSGVSGVSGIGVGSSEGINGMDAASDAAAAANGGDSAGAGVGGVGAGDGGGGIGAGEGLADGGLIGDRPGITKRYADGGPLLAMGFADGGRIAMGAVPSNASVNERVNAILRNPKMRQNIVARAQQLMDSGELTPEEVMTMGRVAEAAMYNPSLYPQLRQFVASQGMTPLPAAYDPSVVTKIIAVSRALQQSTPAGQVPPTTAAAVSPPAPGMRKGGMIHGPGTGRSDSIGTINESTGEPVRVANGEYIIPEHVVRVKGREFFDNLLRRYADVPKEN